MRISQKCFKLTWRVIFDVALQGKILLYGYNRYVIYNIFLIYNIHLYACIGCIKCVCLFVTECIYTPYIYHTSKSILFISRVFFYTPISGIHLYIHWCFPLSTSKTFTCCCFLLFFPAAHPDSAGTRSGFSSCCHPLGICVSFQSFLFNSPKLFREYSC